MSWFDEQDGGPRAGYENPQAPQPIDPNAGATAGGGGVPPGTQFLSDGTALLPDGTVLRAPAGMVRNPQTGLLTPAPGTTPPNVGDVGKNGPLAVPQGDYQAIFNQIFPDASLSPQQLAAKEGELNRYGIKISRNASGLATKVILPNGDIYDPIIGAGSGQNQKAWQLVGGPNYQGGNNGAAGANGTPNLPRWTDTFSYGDFKAPTGVSEQNDPGFDARLKAGQDAIERSAAAKGTLLTGGTVRDENQYAQDYASNEYGNIYNRDLSTYKTNYGNALTAYQTRYNQFLNTYGQALGENNLAYGRGQDEINNAWNRYYGLANLSLQGANGATNAGGQFANAAGNLITGAGNASAAGTVGSGNAWNSALGGIANLGMFASLYGNRGGSGYTPYQPYPLFSY